MGAIIWFGSKVLPFSIAILAAITARLLVTGALHEDGLADSSMVSAAEEKTAAAFSPS